MENIIVGQSISEAVPAPATVTGVSVPLEAWQALTQEIEQLWDAYREALDAAERSKNEAHGFLLEIGKRLSEAKERLARPGRNGGWSSFSRSAGLTRAEADGLVCRYRRSVEPQINCGEEAVSAEAIAAEQPQGPLPVPTGQSADGPEAHPDAAGETAASAPAADPAPQPSADVSTTATQGPSAEIAPTPAEAGQVTTVPAAGGGVQ